MAIGETAKRLKVVRIAFASAQPQTRSNVQAEEMSSMRLEVPP